jgi:hypothetical protein
MAIYTKPISGNNIVNGSATVCIGERTQSYNNTQRNQVLANADSIEQFVELDGRYLDLNELEPQRHGESTTSQVTVTSTPAQVLAADKSRLKALLVNAGSSTIYLGHDNTVSSSNGIPLGASADYEDDVSVDAWWAVVGTGTGDLRVESVS